MMTTKKIEKRTARVLWERWVHCWMVGWMWGESWVDGRTDGRTDGWMDGWMNRALTGDGWIVG